MPSIKKLTDEKLIKLVCDQNQELYREVVERYQNKLLRYAGYLMGDDQEAADVVQEALIKAFISLRGFNDKYKFSSWIYRIVHNQAMTQLKRRKKTVSFEGNDWLTGKLASNEDIVKEYQDKELKKMLSGCLKQIPIKYSEVLVLFYFEEKKYQEISEILQIPMGTVGIRLNRGKKILKKICKEKEIL